MKRESTYSIFIGTTCLLISIIEILRLTIPLYPDINSLFLYIKKVANIALIIDYSIYFFISSKKINYFLKNKIRFLTLIDSRFFIKILLFFGIGNYIKVSIIYYILVFVRVVLLLYRFIEYMRAYVTKNTFVYLLIMTNIIVLLGGSAISLAENIELKDAIWWSFVTFTTVGYGDVLLATYTGKVIAVILMLLGIGCISILTTTIAVHLINGNKVESHSYRSEIIQGIKSNLDNYENLSNEEIDDICKVIKSLK